MLRSKICIFLLLSVSLVTGVIGQEQMPVTDTIQSTKEMDRIDSLHMKVDSLLSKDYGIKAQTDKEGNRLKTAIGFKLSSLGLGLEFTLAFNQKFSLRFAASYYELNTSTVDESLGQESSLSRLTGGSYLVVDYQFIRFMHATVGVIYRVTQEEGTAKAIDGVSIGGIEIPADIVGQIAYAIEQKSVGYYAGIGFGRTISFKRRVAASAHLGVFYLPAEAQVSVNAQGMLSPTATEENVNTVEENAGSQNFYPFISVQISYRLN